MKTKPFSCTFCVALGIVAISPFAHAVNYAYGLNFTRNSDGFVNIDTSGNPRSITTAFGSSFWTDSGTNAMPDAPSGGPITIGGGITVGAWSAANTWADGSPDPAVGDQSNTAWKDYLDDSGFTITLSGLSQYAGGVTLDIWQNSDGATAFTGALVSGATTGFLGAPDTNATSAPLRGTDSLFFLPTSDTVTLTFAGRSGSVRNTLSAIRVQIPRALPRYPPRLQRNGSRHAPPPKLGQVAVGHSSVPLQSTRWFLNLRALLVIGVAIPLWSGAQEPLFQKRSDTGLGVPIQFDPKHPLRRLYHSGLFSGSLDIADFDDDGITDLFLAGGAEPNQLYRGLSDFRFEEVSAKRGLDAPASWCTGSSWVDIDADGDLDLYVCRYAEPNLLFINDGTGHFLEAAEECGLDLVDASLAPAFCDFDSDGDGDGDLDFAAGNLGENSKYKPSSKKPEHIFFGDFFNEGRPQHRRGKTREQQPPASPRLHLKLSSHARARRARHHL